MRKSNYVFLGIALSYIIIAIIQWSISNSLSASLYVTVAFVSLELTLLEMVKSIGNGLVFTIEHQAKVGTEYLQLLQRNKSVFEKHQVLEEQTKAYENKIEEQQQRLQKKSNLKSIHLIKRSISSITILQIVFCTVQILLIPLKFIPYDAITNKTINVLTLLSFGFMFLSYFLSAWINEKKDEVQERLDIERNLSIYYLDIIAKIDNDNALANHNSKEEV